MFTSCDALLASLEPPDSPAEPECGLPDTIPEWVLLELREPHACPCCTEPSAAPADEPPVTAAPTDDTPWATPGVTGLGPIAAGPLPPPSPEVAALVRALAGVTAMTPAQVDGAQALSDAQALLEVEQQLRIHDLGRLADVHARGLIELVGARSITAWARRHRPDGDSGDAVLATRLRHTPVLDQAVQDGRLTLQAARKVTAALRTCGPHLNRADGRIDGQPGDLVLNAVIGNVATLICRDLQGLHDDDPRLEVILARARALLALEGTHATRLEAAVLWLAETVTPRSLTRALDQIVVSVLPSLLEDRYEKGRQRRGITLTELPDGQGWHLSGDLDLECGERLWVVLRAAAAHDARNPRDTAAWNDAREAGATTSDDVFGPLGDKLDADGVLPQGLPRGRRARLHDALSLVLARYLAADPAVLAGTVGKTPVQIHVTVPEATLTSQPGAAPATADSGQVLPRRLVHRWWGDSSITSYVLSLGGKALRTIHTGRTLSAIERRALSIEGGGQCAGDGCCASPPDPLTVLRPHHIHGYAEDQITSLEDTLAICDSLHHDLHTGKRTVRLRDGRWLDETGFVDPPAVHQPPPPF